MTPEERREYAKRYYRKNREKLLARRNKWNNENKEKRSEHYFSNSERILSTKKAYNASNRDKIAAYNSAYATANPEKMIAKYNKRRAVLAGVSVPLTPEEQNLVRSYHAFRRFLSELYGVDFVVDHVHPISAGGLDHPDNYQIITRAENARKKDKTGYTLPAGTLCFRLHAL